ncbi:MAG: glycoside hydrolase family 32 protein [Aggregatilineales bacterium]
MRKQLAGDRHRPHYHFLPPSNWMNDPNGLIQWQGKVHLFYQHNPNGPLWGNMHWGHAVSSDFIHWTDLPIALAPTPGGPDETGVFSGCAVNHEEIPTLIYTGTRGKQNEIQTQCLATSTDNLLTWQKYPENPILGTVPVEAGQTKDFRDPFVWKGDNAWFMVVGSKIKDVGGVVFLYRSPNLIDWEYLHPLLIGDLKRNGVIWECPNFFKLGDSWVLIISSHKGDVTGNAIYFVGSYENYRFVPEYEGVLDYDALYAPLTFLDQHDRRVLFGWIRESRSKAEQQRAGWSGVQSVPRVLELDTHKRLTLAPAPEVERLRRVQRHFGPFELSQPVPLDVTGIALDFVAEFAPVTGGNCGLSVACSPDRTERTDISYDLDSGQLTVSTITPETNDTNPGHFVTAPHVLEDGERLKLRILLDGSVIEIIANDRTSLTSRAYPSQAESNRIQVFGTAARLHSLDVWEVGSIWQ